MSEQSIVAIIVGLCSGGVLTQFVAWAIRKIERKPPAYAVKLQQEFDDLKTRTTVIEDGVKALLFDKISRLHQETVQQGLPVPVSVKQRADAAYQAYKALGGNGVGKHMYEELMDAHAKGGV